MSNSTLFAQVLSELPYFPIDDASTTALLVVDMQYLDAHRDYGIGLKAREKGTDHLLTEYFDRVDQIIPTTSTLLDACRRAGVEVIYTTIAARTENGREISRIHRMHELLAPRGSREAEVLDELAPVGDEIVLHKTSGGVFNSTEIDYILRNLGVETLIVTGVVTNGCVETAVRDAADKGYKVILVPDACAACSMELHNNALKSMGQKLCNLRDADVLLAELQHLAQTVAIEV